MGAYASACFVCLAQMKSPWQTALAAPLFQPCAHAFVLLQVLQAQEDAVQSVQKEARDALLAISGNKKQYQALLTDLLVCICRHYELLMQSKPTCLKRNIIRVS